jgi:hypothetical protein
MVERSPTFRNFIAAFRGHWLEAMSGGFSVPFAFAAWRADDAIGKLIFGLMAFLALGWAAYRIWGIERTARNAAEDFAVPKIGLLQVRERREKPTHDSVIQTFTLVVRNNGLLALSNCLAKVDQIEGGPEKFATTALKTYHHAHTPGPSIFNLRGGETKEVILCRNAVHHGDSFISAELFLEDEHIRIDPDLHNEMKIGFYSEAAPTFVTIRLKRNSDRLMEITSI